jgi:hypothetical protein
MPTQTSARPRTPDSPRTTLLVSKTSEYCCDYFVASFQKQPAGFKKKISSLCECQLRFVVKKSHKLVSSIHTVKNNNGRKIFLNISDKNFE